jgi:hypothetical protein
MIVTKDEEEIIPEQGINIEVVPIWNWLLMDQRPLDFGNGFYTTTNLIQCNAFVRKVLYCKNAGKAIVSHYEFEKSLLPYFSGNMSVEIALMLLKPKKLFNQYTFCTDKAIQLLHFVNSEEVSNE